MQRIPQVFCLINCCNLWFLRNFFSRNFRISHLREKKYRKKCREMQTKIYIFSRNVSFAGNPSFNNSFHLSQLYIGLTVLHPPNSSNHKKKKYEIKIELVYYSLCHHFCIIFYNYMNFFIGFDFINFFGRIELFFRVSSSPRKSFERRALGRLEFRKRKLTLRKNIIILLHYSNKILCIGRV